MKLASHKNSYIKHNPDCKHWTAEKVREVGIHNVVKRMVGFAQDIPESPGETVKNHGHIEAMIDQIFADIGRLPFQL